MRCAAHAPPSARAAASPSSKSGHSSSVVTSTTHRLGAPAAPENPAPCRGVALSEADNACAANVPWVHPASRGAGGWRGGRRPHDWSYRPVVLGEVILPRYQPRAGVLSARAGPAA